MAKSSSAATPYELLSVEAVESEFEVSKHTEYPFDAFGDEQEQRVYRGGLKVEGDLHPPKRVDWIPFNLVIDGDLDVTGIFDWYDFGSGNYVLVTGNLRARAVTLSGCTNLVVLGDVIVEDGIVCSRGDDGGYITVEGETRTPFVLSYLYFNPTFRTPPSGLFIADPDSTSTPVDFSEEQLPDLLVPALVDGDGEVDDRKLLKALGASKPVLRAGLVPAWKATLDALAALPEGTKEVDLREKMLRGFPEELLRFKQLERLVLSKTALGVLPSEIAQLGSLKVLELQNCGLTSLPEELGSLGSLEVLNLGENALGSIPDSLGSLAALRELSLQGVVCPLPKSLSKLKRLERLDFSWRRSNDEARPGAPVEIPAVVFSLTSLLHLDLRMSVLGALPDDVLRLRKLESLELTGSLGRFTSLPALHELPLKRLGFSGHAGNTGAEPDAALLDGIWKIGTLTSLSIDRWKSIKKLPAEAFEAMPGLTELDLSFTPITTLPASFYALEELSKVGLQYTKLTAATLGKLEKAFPTGVRFDLRNIEAKEAAVDDPHWKKVRSLVKKASETYVRAEKIAAYEKVLAACKPGKVYASYDELYASYGLVLALGEALRETKAKKDRAPLIDQCLAAASRALSLVPETIWHFTDQGAFQEEALRQCANALAWFGLERASDEDALLAAFAQLERALPLARAEDTYLRDTQVRLLTKLGRTEEAYGIVDRVLRHDPDADDFKGWKTNEAFLAWRVRVA